VPQKIKYKCIGDPRISALAEDLRLISDPIRLRIICLLSKGERRVSEIVRDLGVSQQLASHHLNALRSKGVLLVRKESSRSIKSFMSTWITASSEIFEDIDIRLPTQ